MAQIYVICKHKEEKISQDKPPQIADFRKVTYGQLFFNLHTLNNGVFDQEQPPTLFSTSSIMNVRFVQLSEPSGSQYHVSQQVGN